MLRTARVVFRTLTWALIGLALVAGVFIGRLSSGPVPVAWLKPRIEQALSPASDEARVAVGQIQLRLRQDRRELELVGIDVRYQTRQGNSFLTFPEVEITLSLQALLQHGIIAASEIVARAPTLVLQRRGDGIIGLYSKAGDDEELANVDLIASVRHLLQPPESDDRAAFLKRLQISGGRVSYYNRARSLSLTANGADLLMLRDEDGVTGWLRAELAQETGLASLRVSGRLDAGADRPTFRIHASNLVPAELPPFWPTDGLPVIEDLAALRIPLRASIEGDLDLEGRLSALRFNIQAAEGTVDLLDHLEAPLEVADFEMKGVVAPHFDALDIDLLHLRSKGADLDAEGRISWLDRQPRLALDLAASGVRANALSSFWPPALAPRVRKWVIENVTSGMVRRADARLDLRPDDFGPAPLRDDAVRGSFSFDGLDVRYVDTMSPLEGASGEARFNADRMDFTVEGGRNAGLRLDGGTVTITGIGKPGKLATELEVEADVHGSIRQALALLDQPPLELAKDLKLTPERASGEMSASLKIRLPLHDDVSKEEVDVVANADLQKAGLEGLPRLGEDVRLRDGAFGLEVNEDEVRLQGTADVNDLPLKITIVEPLVEGKARRRYQLSGDLASSTLRDAGLAATGVEGNVAFNATVTETEDYFWIDLEADLTRLAVALPGVAWTKAFGESGKLLASIAMPNEGPIEVKQFDLSAGDLRAAGAADLARSDYQIISLSLDALHLGDTDASLRFAANEDLGHEITIEAKTLDLDALLADSKKAAIDAGGGRFQLAIRADRLITRGLRLSKVQADAARGADGWHSASFIGELEKGGTVAVELVPDGDSQRLDIRSDDAGALIEALDLGPRVEGGTLHLSARITSQKPLAADGRLEIKSFTLQDAPLLARLLTVASLTGIGNLLGGEGIQVDQLIFPFALKSRTLTLSDGLMRGSQLGLTVKGDIGLAADEIQLEGTIIPVYTINRLIGKVPIIGQILTGSDGRGAFAATYRINGRRSDPIVFVNPLSILAPGLIRDFFGGLFEGTLEPPVIRDSDD